MNAKDFSFGYVPISFPRDTIEFNQFNEHVVAGQILEGLVDADGDGNIVPSVAKDWHFRNSGREIHFTIDANLRFSNGKTVNSSDIVYSIKRHLNSVSQSKYFLADIQDIKALSDDQVVIHLKKNNISILKALTRDQLGIVPSGWTFKSNSDSPYIGTGPYNLVKKNSAWYLEVNEFYLRGTVPIKKWKIVFFKNSKLDMPEEIPTVIPVVTESGLDLVKKSPNFANNSLTISPILGFTQTSFWVHPKGKLYKKKKLRLKVQSLLNEMVADFCKENNLSRATGLIPRGIQGSLDFPVEIEKMAKTSLVKKIKVAALPGSLSDLFSTDNIKRINSKYGISFELKFFTFTETAKVQAFKPDIITGSWAGGFNDPTGFLALIGPLLGEDFKKYLGFDLATQLEAAEANQNFALRAEEFKNIGRTIISEGLLTPGWRVNAFEVRTPSIINMKYQARYTPRLINYTVAD